ncbi:hypothetical protein MKEN_00632100 [Mycena kentingensis (nom. inval.)]|nr:hypothetical protein MKEN_00632100 [Mycena kentingensis (nom. inval.)]
MKCPRPRAVRLLTSATPDVHPYWYAQVLRVFNATVFEIKPSGDLTRSRRVEFLWVRWMGDEPGYRSSVAAGRLPKVGFVNDTDPYAFGFLDPKQVIRAAHLIPEFASGKTHGLLDTLQPTLARLAGEGADYQAFYIDIFADRDMIMRFVGGAIGHLDTPTLLEAMETEEAEADERNPALAGGTDSGDDSDSADSDAASGSQRSESDSEEEEYANLEDDEEPEDDGDMDSFE